MIPRIRQVQIRNFKSIEQAVVDLEPFTAFVGANGSGKSNFLDALRFVSLCVAETPQKALDSRGGREIAPRWQREVPFSTGLRLQIDLDEERSADYAFEIAWDAAAFQVRHELCRIRSRGHEDVFEVAGGEFKQPIPGIRPQIQPDRLALAAASATAEFRAVYDFLAAMQFYSILPEAVRFDAPASHAVLVATGSNASEILARLQPGSEASRRINDFLSRVVPGFIEVHTRKGWAGHLELEFVQDLGGGEPGSFSASEMSEGTLRLMGLLLAVHQPYPSSLVAIEEPEATVHPAAAELVLQVLLDAAQDRQILIITHSPDILDAKDMSDEQIRVVTMSHGRTAITPLAPASRQAIREHLYTPGELLRINELLGEVPAEAVAAPTPY